MVHLFVQAPQAANLTNPSFLIINMNSANQPIDTGAQNLGGAAPILGPGAIDPRRP